MSRWMLIAIIIGALILLAGVGVGIYFLIVYLINIFKKIQSCDESHPCPSGQQCLGGLCVAQGCDANNLCPPGLICVNGQCATPQCDANTPCPGSQICVNGQCQEPQPCGPTNPCPSGQQCVQGQCIIPPTYIKDVIASTDSSCPAGYEPIGTYGDSNGDLKQGAGGGTPFIFLCVKKDNDPTTPPLTDIRAYQFPNGPERACITGSRLTYRYQGEDQYDFEKGCGILSPVTKLCVSYGQSGVFPISDIVVTSADNADDLSCPDGYARYNVDNSVTGGTPGDLNRTCGANKVVMLCVKRS